MISRVVAAVFFGLSLVVNYLANQLPLNDQTTGEISARYANLFEPAGVTFSIWGVIYLVTAAWAIAQFSRSREEVARRIAPAFAAASLLNAAWLFAWHYERLFLSVAIMFLLLASLLWINVRLRGSVHFLPRLAFGLYLGWIIVAAVANVTVLLVGVEWGGAGLSDAFWATLMVGTGAAIGGLATLRLGNPHLAWAVAWGLAGVMLARWQNHPAIAAAAGMSAVVVLAVGFALLRHQFRAPAGTP